MSCPRGSPKLVFCDENLDKIKQRAICTADTVALLAGVNYSTEWEIGELCGWSVIQISVAFLCPIDSSELPIRVTRKHVLEAFAGYHVTLVSR